MTSGTDTPEHTDPLTDTELLRQFLHDRHAPCPRCGYDLRNLHQDSCPECAEPIALQVGPRRAYFGWLLFAMTPGLFSGIAAIVLKLPGMQFSRFSALLSVPTPMIPVFLFGAVSALASVLMYVHRDRWLRWPERRQVWAASAIWLVHLAACAVLFFSIK